MDARLRVIKTVDEHKLINEGDRLVLGLSGGPDSLCLLHVLAGLREKLGFELYALHLNHLMRGADAEADVAFLKSECAALKVPLTVVRCDVYKKAEDENTSPEEAGRIARHEALSAEAARLAADGSGRPAKIVFAHNRGDQAETVLMRIFRGTGIHGLAAMEYEREDGVIRPLLDTPRSEVEEFCTKNSLKPRFDSTNASDDYTRNRLRHHLIPQLEEEYNPNLKDVLFRLAENAREDDAYLLKEAAQALEGLVTARGEGFVKLDAKKLRAMDPAIQKRVISMAFRSIGLTQDIASVHLNPLCRTLNANLGGRTVEFPSGYAAVTSARALTLKKC